MKRLFLLVSFFYVLIADAQHLQWNDLLEENSGGFSFIRNSSLNNNGHIFSFGVFNGILDLDPNANGKLNIINPLGSTKNLFFARYDDHGDLIYGHHLRGVGDMENGGLALDGSNNLYLSGFFNDTIDLNPGSIQALYIPVSSNAEDAFYVKYNHQGVFQWARQLTSTIYTRPKDIVLDNSGNIIVAGSFKGTTDFNAGSGVQNLSAIDQDIFIAKYNSSGNYINAIKIGAFGSPTGIQEVSNLETDLSNNIYVSGRFEGTVNFNPSGTTSLLTSKGKNDFYIAKYNSALQLTWVYQLGSGGSEGVIDHKIYGNELWLAGSFKDTIDTDLKSGTNLHISQGLNDVFFAKYSLSANYLISKSIGGSGNDEATSIEVYNSDSLYITGHFEGTVDFDPSTSSSNLTSSASKSTFFGAYNALGELNWISKVTGSKDVTSAIIRANTKGNPYLIGQLKGNADFNYAGAPFSKAFSGPASFIAKYGKCGDVNIAVSTVDATCGKKDGSAIATVTGGKAPLRYSWTSGHTSNSVDSLRSNMYYLTITDTLNCQFYSDPIMINEVGGPVVSVASKVQVTCNGGSNAAVSLNVTGGISPYTFQWSNGRTAQSINGLKAGYYEVTVTDDNGCKSHLRVEIKEPDAIQVFPVISKPSCGASNGSVKAVVVGGVSPYSYSWLPFGSGNTLTSIGSGVYKVTVTDANSCNYTQSIAISNDKAPDIFLDSVRDVSCGSGGGGIYISVYGGSPGYSYLWNPGSMITQDIFGIQPDNYELIVTDNANCKSVFVQTLKSKKAVAPEVCIVDVDSINGNATVVWEKPTNRGSADYYNIYRETTTLNVFDLIKDKVDFTDMSAFEDPLADTWTRPWSYKISLTDTCGVESDLSSFHTTIHTVITQNAQQEFNILWSPYKGNFLVGSYTCYRYTDTTGTIDSVTTVPANIFSFTDKNSPSSGTDVYYFIKVNHPFGCTATDGAVQHRNSTRSNRGSMIPPKYLFVSQVFDDDEKNNLLLFPNPAYSVVNIELTGKINSEATISLLNVSGREILSKNVKISRGTKSYAISIDELPPGLYLVKVQKEGKIFTGKLIVSYH